MQVRRRMLREHLFFMVYLTTWNIQLLPSLSFLSVSLVMSIHLSVSWPVSVFTFLFLCHVYEKVESPLEFSEDLKRQIIGLQKLGRILETLRNNCRFQYYKFKQLSISTSYLDVLPFCQGLKGDSDCHPQMRENWLLEGSIKAKVCHEAETVKTPASLSQ